MKKETILLKLERIRNGFKPNGWILKSNNSIWKKYKKEETRLEKLLDKKV
jgi:hypothetical protein